MVTQLGHYSDCSLTQVNRPTQRIWDDAAQASRGVVITRMSNIRNFPQQADPPNRVGRWVLPLPTTSRHAWPALAAHHSIQNLPAGRPVVGSNSQLAVLVAGLLRICHHRTNGHRQIISLLFPGDIIEFSQISDFVEIESATDVRICRMTRTKSDSMLNESRGYRLAVLASRQRVADRLREHVWALAALRPDERVALFLSDCCAIMPWQPLPSGGGILTMQLSRLDIAAYLGTTAETVCRSIAKLGAAGLIRARGPKHFEIPDLPRLSHFVRTERSPAMTATDHKLPVADDRGQCESGTFTAI